MDTVQCIKWLKDNGLYELSHEVSKTIKNIFTPCLSARDEKILIVGDTGSKDRHVSAVLSGAYYLAAQQLRLDTKMIFQEVKSRGHSADENVINSLGDLDQGNIIILNMSDKLGSIKDLGKSFRKWIKKRDHRFVSAMSLGDLQTEKVNLITKAIDLPYKPLQAQHEELRSRLDRTKEIHVTTEAGTDLYYNVDGITSILADGKYTTKGSGGNLPAGEIYLPPNKKNVSGKIVIDGSSRTHEHTLLIKDPITLNVEEGSIVNITGGKEAKELEKTLNWATSLAKNPGGVRRICEFGIGLNPRASIIGAMIVDDKALGTAHVGIGSNYWFGGSIYAIIHLDQVFKTPNIKLDGEELKI